ncbi:MAG: YegP family protein [Mucilaginibacter sp.]|uniref:YegP family protein n=1 Tax=Mucilaginibacter sp. TaxID=1882438 RepID=UPI0031A2D7EE
MGKFLTKTGKDGQHYFNLVATNGQVILSGEGYTTASAMNNGIESVKKNAPQDARYDREESKNGKFYFNLKATNGQVIGKSQMYESATSRDNGIESVKKNAPEAPVVEEE